MTQESSDNFLNEPFEKESAAPPASDLSDAGRQTSPFRVPSVEEIITILTQNNAAKHEFSSETEQYRVESSLQRNNRRWVYRSTVYHNTVQMMDGEFGPEESRKEALPDEWRWEGFVKEAAIKHHERCRKVAAVLAASAESGKTGGIGKTLLKIGFLALLISSLLLNAAALYLYFEQTTLRTWLGGPVGPVNIPHVRLRYETVRGAVEKDNGVPTIVLQKTDIVTVKAVNDHTGETIAQDLINIRLDGERYE